MRTKGFTLIEILVVIGIIAVLATIVSFAAGTALRNSRDASRKDAISQVGRLLAGGQCYMPNAGAGDYDIGDLVNEIKAKYPQYAYYFSLPKDPKGGTAAVTKYRYVVSADGRDCAIYANLENPGEPVTLTGITAPTPGGGTGVFATGLPGPNGSNKYFQAANR